MEITRELMETNAYMDGVRDRYQAEAMGASDNEIAFAAALDSATRLRANRLGAPEGPLPPDVPARPIFVSAALGLKHNPIERAAALAALQAMDYQEVRRGGGGWRYVVGLGLILVLGTLAISFLSGPIFKGIWQ